MPLLSINREGVGPNISVTIFELLNLLEGQNVDTRNANIVID
jgi:hypothetical protein